MSVRNRIALVSALGTAIVVIIVTSVAYLAELQDLRGGVDRDLTERAAAISSQILGSGEVPSIDHPPFGVPIAYAQVVSADAEVVPLAPGTPALPVDARVVGVADGTQDRFYRSATIADVHLRILTVPLRPGTALQIARPVDEIDFHAFRLGLVMTLLAVAGVGMATVLGRFVARSSLRPVESLIQAAERVAKTRDLAQRIEVRDDTELGRLAEAFNEMVSALDVAQHQQQQLVIDASHELQTPLAVLRSNLDLLDRAGDDERLDRSAVIADMKSELRMMSQLVSNLVELARPPAAASQWTEVDLAEMVAGLIDVIATRNPDLQFEMNGSSARVLADVERFEVALRNVFDNAVMWGGADGKVSVFVSDEYLTVRDSGPGIDPGDLPLIFGAFYRSPAARALPGSGLGLAILRKTVDEHGWRLQARNTPTGGAEIQIGFAAASGIGTGAAARESTR